MVSGWTPAARIGRRPSNELFCVDVLLRYSRPTSLDAAIEKVRQGSMVFVRREDAPAVLAAVRDG